MGRVRVGLLRSMAVADVVQSTAAFAANHVAQVVAVQCPQLAPEFCKSFIISGGVVYNRLAFGWRYAAITYCYYVRPVARKLSAVGFLYDGDVHSAPELLQLIPSPVANLPLLCVDEYSHAVCPQNSVTSTVTGMFPLTVMSMSLL